MNRRDFLKLSGCIISNILFFPIIKKGKDVYYIETVDDFFDLQSQQLEPGAVVYWRQGIYKLRDQQEQVEWTGSDMAPIISTPFENEEVRIDGCINIRGLYQIWHGFEIYNSRWISRETDEGVWEAFNVDAPHTTIEGCSLHDCRQGIRASTGDDHYLTIENCRIWNNGWMGEDRGHGHGVYWNGNSCTIRNNWFGKGYSEWAVHVYGNISDNLICENNRIEDGMILVSNCENAIITKNEVKMVTEDDTRFVTYIPTEGDNIFWDKNTYLDYREGDYNFTYGMSFNEWKEKYGFDLHSSYWITEEKRKKKVLKKLYPGVQELNQELGDTVVRLPPAVHAVWLKDIEES